jgi:hypothetical protein
MNDVIPSTGTVRVAEPLGVPGQKHWHGRINLGHGKGANGAISNIFVQCCRLHRDGLVGAKEGTVEMGVVQSCVGGFGRIRTTSGRGAPQVPVPRDEPPEMDNMSVVTVPLSLREPE